MKNTISTTRSIKILLIFIVIGACSHPSAVREKELDIISYSGPHDLEEYNENLRCHEIVSLGFNLMWDHPRGINKHNFRQNPDKCNLPEDLSVAGITS